MFKKKHKTKYKIISLLFLLIIIILSINFLFASQTASIKSCLIIRDSNKKARPCIYKKEDKEYFKKNNNPKKIFISTKYTDKNNKIRTIKITDFSIGKQNLIKNIFLNNTIIIKTKKPFFSGKTNEANVFVYLILKDKYTRGVVKSNNKGEWFWQVPKELSKGVNKIYLAISKKDNFPNNDYYSISFMVGENNNSIPNTTIIEKLSGNELRKIKNILQSYSKLEINNNKNIFFHKDRVNFNFDLKTKNQKNIKGKLFFKLKTKNNITLDQKSMQIDSYNLPIFNSFFLFKNYDPGLYYIESKFIQEDKTIIFNQANFSLLEKKNKFSIFNFIYFLKSLIKIKF